MPPLYKSVQALRVVRNDLAEDEYIMFHGTSRANYDKILAEGFKPSSYESSALGQGVYLTKSAFKAMEFARKEEGRMIVVRVRLGRIYRVRDADDPMIKDWAAAGYDSAWAEGAQRGPFFREGRRVDAVDTFEGAVFRRHEVCVADPSRVTVLFAKKPFRDNDSRAKVVMLALLTRIADKCNSTVPPLPNGVWLSDRTKSAVSRDKFSSIDSFDDPGLDAAFQVDDPADARSDAGSGGLSGSFARSWWRVRPPPGPHHSQQHHHTPLFPPPPRHEPPPPKHAHLPRVCCINLD